MRERDVSLADGSVLHAYDSGHEGDDARLAVAWHHGTPNVGLPPEPLFATSDRLGIRWISYDRPGYGGSTPRPGRDIASAAADIAAVADALEIGSFAVMGHSGGASHALASAALLTSRVRSVLSVSALAPFAADGLDWFDGMATDALRAAAAGREVKERYEASVTDDDPGFIKADHEAFAGRWGWFEKVVRPAMSGGPAPMIDDDLAYVAAWGFDPADITVPTLLLHGDLDQVVPSAHARWLAQRIPGAELWLKPDDGHISILESAPAALEWLALAATGAPR